MDDSSPIRTTRVTKVSFFGLGAIVQIVGLVIAFNVISNGFIAQMLLGSTYGDAARVWMGIAIAAVFLVSGSSLSKKYFCGRCMNRLEGKEVTQCPACGAWIDG